VIDSIGIAGLLSLRDGVWALGTLRGALGMPSRVFS
jgi:hypothetical protein